MTICEITLAILAAVVVGCIPFLTILHHNEKYKMLKGLLEDTEKEIQRDFEKIENEIKLRKK